MLNTLNFAPRGCCYKLLKTANLHILSEVSTPPTLLHVPKFATEIAFRLLGTAHIWHDRRISFMYNVSKKANHLFSLFCNKTYTHFLGERTDFHPFKANTRIGGGWVWGHIAFVLKCCTDKCGWIFVYVKVNSLLFPF